ncbi:MAG: UpxY family transcription antiterminator [Tannerellaceae bacterium]|jgi:transcription antitermination factor NusG|nr:UpxY family transcription antiterminator [Tannerellaceae bacterium]
MTNNLNHILNWYVLYTSPRAEKQVKERIALKGVECWLPLHRAPRVWSDRVKLVDIPLFNSYVFVKCNDYELRDLLKIYGVVRIVYYDGKPAIIRQKEIDAIKEFLEKAQSHTLLVGDDVEILTGPFKNVAGKVEKINKNHLILYIDQIGYPVCVDLSEVAPVKRLI